MSVQQLLNATIKMIFLYLYERRLLGKKSNFHVLFFSVLINVFLRLCTICVSVVCNGNRTDWSPIRAVIIRMITKSDDRAAGVRFVYHQYDYRPKWTTRSVITD